MSRDVIKERRSNNLSSQIKNEYLRTSSQKTFVSSKEVPVVIKNAEEEVVALILSAIVGSIIDRWEVPSNNRLSELCSICKSNEKIQYSTCSLHDNKDSYGPNYRSTYMKTKSDLSNQFITTKKSVDEDKSQDIADSNRSIDAISKTKTELSSLSNESSVKEKLSQLSSIDEELVLPQDIKFMSLFEDIREKIFGWSLLKMNLGVIIQFKQGNRYEGGLSRCRMEGHGKFFWAEGSTYEGDFSNGEMTGEGWLEWADQSWYEGEMLQGYRHGRGLYIQSPNFYCGDWACGQRHGNGSMFHDRSNTQRHYYSGEWSRDCKHGTGLRSYPSGAMYSGQWDSGLRHGLGTMVWINNDVYNGNWEYGYIHGYGEYTWGTFFNSNLAVPQENCFYGNWDRGVRNGNGTLETTLGVVVRGTWKNGKKHGPAQVICSNGYTVYADDLFVEDCVSVMPQLSTDSDRASQQMYHVPVNAASHEINLTFYFDRLSNYFIECKRIGKHFKKPASPNQFESAPHTFSYRNDSKKQDTLYNLMPIETKGDVDVEEISLRNIVLQYLSALKMVYSKYSEMCCEVKPRGVSVMMRLMLWQLFRDCNLHTRGYSLADLDILIANNKATLVQGVHYPFERLWFWQFLHCLIELSWEFYGKKLVGTSAVQGILASAFHKLITQDILPNAGRHKGMVLLKYKNLLSLDSVYWFYRGLGEPLSARKLLTNIFVTSVDSQQDQQLQIHTNQYVKGKNIIGVGGKLLYYSPLLKETKPAPEESSHPQNLSCLGRIGLLAVFDCLLSVCPSVASDSLIVNMDYKLVYLEFYEILLSCAKVQAKRKIQERKKQEEETVENIFQTQNSTVVDESIKVEEVMSSKAGKKARKQSPKKKNKKLA